MLPLSGCSISNEMDSYRPVTDVNNLDGRRIGVIAAWAEDYILSKLKISTDTDFEAFLAFLCSFKYSA